MLTDKNNELGGAIVRTLAFFDIFHRPLTLIEVWRYLPVKAAVGEVRAALDQAILLGGQIGEFEGYYFLHGRESDMAALKYEQLVSAGKYRIALKAARWLRFIWGVKLVAVCNNFGYKEDSDIDVFIITARGRLWLVRAGCTAVLHLARLRRHGNAVKDRICLSFYAGEDGLDLSAVTLADDPYFYHWLGQMAPAYDAGGAYQRFWQANSWIKDKFPNLYAQAPTIRRSVGDNMFSRVLKINQGLFFWGSFGKRLERLARYLQRKKMSFNTHSAAAASDTRVVISDTMLKFHENDRREHYREVYYRKLRGFNIQ